jgi:hypothetical protein
MHTLARHSSAPLTCSDAQQAKKFSCLRDLSFEWNDFSFFLAGILIKFQAEPCKKASARSERRAKRYKSRRCLLFPLKFQNSGMNEWLTSIRTLLSL